MNNSIGVIGLSQQRMSSNRPVSRDSKVRNTQFNKQGNQTQYQQHRQQVNNFFQFQGGQPGNATANPKAMMRGGTGNMTSNNFFPSHQLASQNSALLSQTTSSKQAIG